MWKLLVLVLCAASGTPLDSSSRQKKLLFFDEQGNLVKTYPNPYLYNFGNTGDNRPQNLYNYLNPFYNIFRPNTFSQTSVYTIPVSDAVLKQLQSDPLLYNQLIVPQTTPLVERNPLCSGRRTQIPSPKLCSNFLNCWDGWAWEQECPAGLMFSNEGYCDYAYNVDCRHRHIKEETPMCTKDFEAFKNNANCHEFFVCVHKLPVRFQCPVELAYNEDIGVCDYPANVKCNMTHIEPATKPVEGAPVSNEISNQSPTAPDNKFMISKTEYNSQSWKSLQVATSRQDAIRQLQVGQLAHLHTGY